MFMTFGNATVRIKTQGCDISKVKHRLLSVESKGSVSFSESHTGILIKRESTLTSQINSYGKHQMVNGGRMVSSESPHLQIFKCHQASEMRQREPFSSHIMTELPH